MNKKVVLAFAISGFLGFGYLGYLYFRKRNTIQFIEKNLLNEKGIEKQNVEGLVEELKSTSLPFLQDLQSVLLDRKGNIYQTKDNSGYVTSKRSAVVEHPDFQKGNVQHFIEKTVFKVEIFVPQYAKK